MRYGTETKLTAEEVLDRARTYLGPGGEVGLPEASLATGTITFSDQTGFVNVAAANVDGHTDVTILSREYDYWAERFLRQLHR
jgi:hypothetical protein